MSPQVPPWTSDAVTLSAVATDPKPARPDGLTKPHPSRFSPARPDYEACLVAHDAAVADRQAGYLDPGTGLFVMTASYLLERGWCCDKGCRHCPFVTGE